jgi:D-inositol-3-phosphate glycosyltransferase
MTRASLSPAKAQRDRLARWGQVAALRARAALSRDPIGRCEAPLARLLPADGPTTFVGWVVSRRPVRVLVRRDGVVLAETTPTVARPDVVRVYPHAGPVTGWTVEVDIGPDDAAGVDVVAVAGGAETVLSRFRVGPATSPAAPAPLRTFGAVDHPVPGQCLEHPVVHVFGWVALDGEPADVIDVYLDDGPPVRARRCDPRPDLAGAGIFPDSTALTAGYSALVVISPGDRPRPAVLRVVGRSMDGRLWTPPSVPLTVGPRAVDNGPRPLGPPGALPHVIARGVGPAATRPRVCVFTHSLRLGGGELYLQELLLRLADADVADFLVVAPEDGALRPQLEAAGVTVHVTSGYAVDPDRYEARLAELAALMASWRADVALVNTLGVFPAADAALRLGLPVIWAIHESFPLEVFSLLNWGPDGLHPRIADAWRRCLATADQVVFESEATRELLEREVPGISGRCIRYGIDPTAISRYEDDHDRADVRAELGFSADQRVLLCMGVFLDRKSQLALVHAFADLAALYPDARLVLVGDHPSDYARAVHGVVRERGVADVVRLEPIDPDIYRWYRAADVLVSASDTESLPRSVLEAMTFGLPTLAVDVFGLSEVISDGINGWLCEPCSGVALVAGLRRVLRGRAEELAEMSAQARADAKAFDGQGYATAYHQLIAELTHRARTAGPRSGDQVGR